MWDQSIFDEDLVFVFDTWACVFVWIGDSSPVKERELVRGFMFCHVMRTSSWTLNADADA